MVFYKYFFLPVSLLLIFPAFIFSQDIKPSADSLKEGAINVFVDCNFCDLDFFRKQVKFVNYVRDRKEAQVHILSAYQPTASGGGAYTFFFIGQKKFTGINDTLVYNSKADATMDEKREGQIRVIKMGLLRYVSKTPMAGYISIDMNTPLSTENVKDKWKSWVFNFDAGGFMSGEQLHQSFSTWTSVSAKRITEKWKIEFNLGSDYNESRYQVNDTTKIKSITRSKHFNHLLVKSLNDHWSAGGFMNAGSSDYINIKLSGNASPAIEYDLFPYSQATRKQLRILYSAGYDYFYYKDTTIFNKTEEGLWSERLAIAFEIKQKWGSLSSAIVGSNYLHDFSLYNVFFRPGINVRIFKGLSVRLGGSISLIHDQIALPKAGATLAQILLQQRQLATQYSYWATFGISYTFGSIYNNVVNPRFNQ